MGRWFDGGGVAHIGHERLAVLRQHGGEIGERRGVGGGLRRERLHTSDANGSLLNNGGRGEAEEGSWGVT